MGLFDKKYCDICGEKIGLLGNRKLEDGNLCKDCAKKLSPWFSDRRNSTVAEIKEQLEYRERNEEDVARFHTTRTLGSSTRILLDEDAQKFMVTYARNIQDANPDVLDYSQVTGCRINVDESRIEIEREGPDGKKVSYNPPRYEYSYDFDVIISVNHPYFSEMKFRLNDSSIELHSQGGPGFSSKAVDPRTNMEYLSYEKLGQEIVEALTSVRQTVRDNIAAAKAPRQAVICPCCGASTFPDASGCCEYCGSPVK